MQHSRLAATQRWLLIVFARRALVSEHSLAEQPTNAMHSRAPTWRPVGAVRQGIMHIHVTIPHASMPILRSAFVCEDFTMDMVAAHLVLLWLMREVYGMLAFPAATPCLHMDT